MFFDETLDNLGKAMHIRSTGINGQLGALLGQPRDRWGNLLDKVWLVAFGHQGRPCRHFAVGKLIALV